MSDPIERMNHLHEDVADTPVRPASEVRRRGDRLRRRRTIAITSGVAVAVVAIVTPVAVLASGGTTNDSPVDPAGPSESTSAPAPASTLSEQQLLRDEDTEFDGQAQWRQGGTTTSEGDRPSDPCLGTPAGELGAELVFQRDWGLEAHGLSQVVAEFPAAADAVEAYADITEPRVDCKPLGARPSGDDGYLSGEGNPLAVPAADEAMVWEANFSLNTDEGGEAFADHRVFMGVARSGDRLTVLYHDMPDADYDWGATSPVERMLPTAVERLIDDQPPPVSESDPEPPSQEWRTDIPADFPIDRDLSAPEGDPISGPGPNARGITAIDVCGDGSGAGQAQWPAPFEDRLAASATGPGSYLDARELITMPDSDAAAAVLADISRLVAECGEPRDGVVWTEHDAPAIGDETLVVTRTFELGLGGDIHQFTRVGNAILAVDRGGEWELTTTVPAGIDEVGAVSASIVDEMCLFAEAGC